MKLETSENPRGKVVIATKEDEALLVVEDRRAELERIDIDFKEHEIRVYSNKPWPVGSFKRDGTPINTDNPLVREMNIDPICQTAMGFLKENVFRPSLGTVINIGEICEIDWYEGAKQEKAGSIFVTIDDPRVVGFKRVK